MSAKAKRLEVDPLLDLAERIVEVEHAIHKLESQNEKVFEKHKSLIDLREGLMEQTKVLARRRSIVKTTQVLLDTSEIHIHVVGRVQKDFDYSIAKGAWPKHILDAVTPKVIDAKVVEKLVKNGTLPNEDAELALVETPLTPAVTIKVVPA